MSRKPNSSARCLANVVSHPALALALLTQRVFGRKCAVRRKKMADRYVRVAADELSL